jgi:hypothetical protein
MVYEMFKIKNVEEGDNQIIKFIKLTVAVEDSDYEIDDDEDGKHDVGS